MLPTFGSLRHFVAGAGVNRWALAVSTSGLTCRNADTSRIHKLRPCVAATISPAVGWMALVHFRPPSRVTHKAPSSVPTQSTSGFRGDSASAVALPRFVRVISGEIDFRSSPCLTERNTWLAPTYMIRELWADRMNGV